MVKWGRKGYLSYSVCLAHQLLRGFMHCRTEKLL